MQSSRMRTGRSLTICWSLLSEGDVCSGGVSAPGVVSAPGGCLLQGCLLPGVSPPGVVSAPGGVSAPRGVCYQGEGVSAPRGVVSQHALRQTPHCGQNHRHEKKHNLGYNFVAAGKYMLMCGPSLLCRP